MCDGGRTVAKLGAPGDAAVLTVRRSEGTGQNEIDETVAVDIFRIVHVPFREIGMRDDCAILVDVDATFGLLDVTSHRIHLDTLHEHGIAAGIRTCSSERREAHLRAAGVRLVRTVGQHAHASVSAHVDMAEMPLKLAVGKR